MKDEIKNDNQNVVDDTDTNIDAQNQYDTSQIFCLFRSFTS